MTEFKRISLTDAQPLLQDDRATLVDIRDAQSYSAAHIPSAQHVDGSSAADFIESANKEKPLVVYCYHGNSSQSAAAYFASQGFQEVYSLDGGFELWRRQQVPRGTRREERA